MAERVVTIKLMAEATGLVQGMGRAKDAVAETNARVKESARSNREAWTKVGGALTAVGVAVTGVGVAALKTGIQYNTLQQTTRAALTSLLGSAQAANAQMDQLDDFARNSPFSKATFITAQQQMLAFGIEAKKVIPYLNGVQNAVAAAGGSNADIEGIVATMSKIQSSAKITATDLMQFGNRGVNAAELIGSQMGKTGAQIREDITAGALSAEDALDALAKGMNETYAGAADNVKNTFAGALDRVSAAWRDFSAELATPLVDPNGGGALVDLLNWAADAMRAFEDLPGPVKGTATALTGLVGVGSLVVGSAMLILPRWLEMTDALKTMGLSAERTRAALGKVGPAALAIGVALASAHLVDAIDDFRGVKTAADDLERSLRKTGDVSADLVRAFSGSNPLSQFGAEAVVADNNLRQLNTGIGKFRATWESSPLGKAMSIPLLGFGRDLGVTKEQLEEFDAALSASVTSGRVEEAAAGFEELSAMLREAGWSQEDIIAQLPKYAAAQEDAALATAEAEAGVGSIATQYQEAADKASELASKVVGLIEAIGELNGIGQSAEQTNATLQESFSNLQEYVANAQAGVEGYVLSLDQSTVAGSANRAMLAAHASEVENDAKAQFELESKTIGATAAAANFEARLRDGRQQIYDTALALSGSADEAQKLTDRILKMPDQKDIDVLLRGAQEAESALHRLNAISLTPKILTIEEQHRRMFVQPGKAAGGTVGYASGGTIGLAAGGMVPGIGGGIASGTVYGRGTTTSDSVLVRLSKGEEVIRASEAAKHRSLLKQINAGMYAPGLQASNFVPSAPQTIVVEKTVVEHVPASITVRDANNALIGTMTVVADGRIDAFAEEGARASRLASLDSLGVRR